MESKLTYRQHGPRKLTRATINSLVDKAADLIRTAVDYRFILVLLFMKRVDDSRRRGRHRFSRQDERQFEYAFKIPKQYLWTEITKNVKTLPENLAAAITEIAALNPKLENVINRVDFLDFARNRENRELLRQLVGLFNSYDLAEDGLSSDALGDAYEHIVLNFAPDRAKEGEIYTPREVIDLMVKILDPKPGDALYDPCCGSAGMLIISFLYVRDRLGERSARKLSLFGQERSPQIYAVGEMNLMFHNIRNANLENGDTLENPRFRNNGNLRQFDIGIANVPWNQDGYNEERLTTNFPERFSFGFPPQSSADWAWIQHLLASTKQKGRVAVIVDNGCLFRGGREKGIRTRIVEKDWVECVILLPEKLFYNTGAPGAIVVLNKNKLHGESGDLLFVNASNEFVPHTSVRRLNALSLANIKKIEGVYRSFSDVPGFSRVVKHSELAKNDYNLNVSLYVMPIEESRKISIPKVYSELKQLETEREKLDKALGEALGQIKED